MVFTPIPCRFASAGSMVSERIQQAFRRGTAAKCCIRQCEGCRAVGLSLLHPLELRFQRAVPDELVDVDSVNPVNTTVAMIVMVKNIKIRVLNR